MQIEKQIERLRRHYDASVRTYDEVSFLDLSHSLRIWVEIGVDAYDHFPSLKSNLAFKSATPTKAATKLAENYSYIFSYMPEGVRTFASEGKLVGSSTKVPSGGETFGCSFKTIGKGQGFSNGMEMKNFFYVGAEMSDQFRERSEHCRVRRCNFQNWLGSEAARYRFPMQTGKIVKSSISRSMLIKRVANGLDGSHASKNSGGELKNQYDSHIQFLMNYKWANLPLPYFLLLHAAQMILVKLGVEIEASGA